MVVQCISLINVHAGSLESLYPCWLFKTDLVTLVVQSDVESDLKLEATLKCHPCHTPLQPAYWTDTLYVYSIGAAGYMIVYVAV